MIRIKNGLLLFTSGTFALMVFVTGLILMLLPVPLNAAVSLAPIMLPIILILALNYPFLCLCILTFFIPLEAFANFAAFIEKLTFLKIIGFFVLVGFLIHHAMTKTRDTIASMPHNLSLFFFGLVVLCSSLFSTIPTLTMLGLRKFTSMFLLFFLITNIAKKEKNYKILFIIFLIAFTISCGYSIASYFLGFNPIEAGNFRAENIPGMGKSENVRVVGGLGKEPNQWGNFVVYMLPFALTPVILFKKIRYKFFFIILTCCFAFTIVTTYSRQAFLGLFFFLFLFVIRYYKEIPVFKVLVILLCLGALSLFFLTDYYIDRMAYMFSGEMLNEAEADRSTLRRESYYKVGVRAFFEDPLLGAGPFHFAYVYQLPQYRELALLERSEPGRFPHSQILDLIVNYGLMGFITFYVFFYLCWRNANKARKHLENIGKRNSIMWLAASGFELSLISNLFLGFFEESLVFKHNWFLLSMSAATWLVVKNMKAGKGDILSADKLADNFYGKMTRYLTH